MQLLHMCFTSMELLLRGLPPLIVTSVSSLSLLSEKVYVECGVSFLVDVLTYESLVCLVDISSTTHRCHCCVGPARTHWLVKYSLILGYLVL